MKKILKKKSEIEIAFFGWGGYKKLFKPQLLITLFFLINLYSVLNVYLYSKIEYMSNLTKKVISDLKTNNKARYRLSYEFNVSENTINRMIAKEEQGIVTSLQTPMGIKAISEELKIRTSAVIK